MSNLRRNFVTLQTAENSAPSLVRKGEEWDKGELPDVFHLARCKTKLQSFYLCIWLPFYIIYITRNNISSKTNCNILFSH